MVRHLRRLFQRAAVLKVGGDAGRPEAVVADIGLDPGGRRPPADHRVGLHLGQRRPGRGVRAPADRPD